MNNNYLFVLKITGMNLLLRWIVQLSNSNALRFRNWSFTIIAVLALISFSTGISAGAAPSRYNINVQYKAEQAVIPEYLKADEKTRGAVITVAEFTDARQVDDKKIVGRVRERDDTRVPIFLKDVLPAGAVAEGIKEYLKKAGYKVADKSVQWDLKETTMPKGNGKVIIGGSIEEMEEACWTGIFSNSYKTNVKLTIVIGDLTKDKILYKTRVESSSSRDDVSFSEEEIGGQLSAALGDAIEKIFEEKALAQKIKEAITQ